MNKNKKFIITPFTHLMWLVMIASVKSCVTRMQLREFHQNNIFCISRTIPKCSVACIHLFRTFLTRHQSLMRNIRNYYSCCLCSIYHMHSLIACDHILLDSVFVSHLQQHPYIAEAKFIQENYHITFRTLTYILSTLRFDICFFVCFINIILFRRWLLLLQWIESTGFALT